MRNKFGGHCAVCGEWVEPLKGHFRTERGVYHTRLKGPGRVNCAEGHQQIAIRDESETIKLPGAP